MLLRSAFPLGSVVRSCARRPVCQHLQPAVPTQLRELAPRWPQSVPAYDNPSTCRWLARSSDTPGPTDPDAQEYWEHKLSQVTKSSVEHFKEMMDVTYPTGVTPELIKQLKARAPLHAQFVDWKVLYPKYIVMMQIGAFYETVGLDALMLMQWLDLQPMAGSIPRAGFPTSQLESALQPLHLHGGFKAAIVIEEAISPSPGRKAIVNRVLLDVSTPARPLYVPSTEPRGGDASNQVFKIQRPMFGVGHSKSGFITLVLSPELDTIEKRMGMTWEAVLALMAAKGADEMLLHESLNEKQMLAYRNDLRRLQKEVGSFTTYNGDVINGFVREVQAMLLVNPREAHIKDRGLTFRMVECHDREDGRPQPLPRSTAMQLGLEENTGSCSLLSAVLPASAATSCQAWTRENLMMPPPPPVAAHVQGMVSHLGSTDKAMSSLNTDLPATKIMELLRRRKGDAFFFRELHGMVVPVVEMLRNGGHAELWRHALPYALWMGHRSTVELTAGEFLARLQQAVHLIKDLVVLQPTPALNLTSGPTSETEPSDTPAAAATSKKRGQSPDADEELRAYRASHESCFRSNVKEQRLGPSIQKVDKAWAELLDATLRFRDELSQQPRGAKAAAPSVKNVGDDILAVHVPKAAVTKEVIQGIAKAMSSDAAELTDSKGKLTDAWVTSEMTDKRSAYKSACSAAKQQAVFHMSELCASLVPQSADLLLACRCSVVIAALHQDTRVAIQAKWSIPQLIPSQGGSSSSEPHGMRLTLEDFWPYWMAQGHPTVMNSIVLDRMVLLTGANMAGKSTVLRAMCGAILLANCGFMVPALRAHVPFYDAFVLRNFSGDSPVENMSSFAMEMQEVSAADKQCTSRSLVLLDEMCKGTEVAKGTALAAAMIISWCMRGFTGVFASHLHALVSITRSKGLESQGLLEYKRMGLTDGKDGNRKGTWRLEDGSCAESLAFEVARDQGMREEVLTDAQSIYEDIRNGQFPLTGEDVASAHTPDVAAGTPSGTTLDTSWTYRAPAFSLDGALAVLQGVAGQWFKNQEHLVYGTAKAGQEPPSSHSVGVYVVQWANGAFYCGQTSNLTRRLEEHRMSSATNEHAGPETSMVYCLMPDGEAHAARKLEPKVISALKDNGFPLTSSKDEGRRPGGQ